MVLFLKSQRVFAHFAEQSPQVIDADARELPSPMSP